jgi:hypothetical protein
VPLTLSPHLQPHPSPHPYRYDTILCEYVDEIALRQEEARNAQERSAARQRIRATFDVSAVATRLKGFAKPKEGPPKPNRRGSQMGGANGGGTGRRQSVKSVPMGNNNLRRLVPGTPGGPSLREGSPTRGQPAA